ncbi:MAG: hypothetical protein E7231_00025 [Cellulosilyticum sp.]|nr:hypothetical protein [Cellulosilyticum sp.]
MLQSNLNELYVKIPNTLPLDEELSNKAVAIYYYIAECATLGNYAVVSLRNLLKQFGYKNVDRYYSQYILALEELEEEGYIEIFNEEFKLINAMKITKDDILYINLEGREYEYFSAYIGDVHNIMRNSKTNHVKQREDIIRYYLVIQRWTNYKDFGDQPKEAEHGRRIAYYTATQANREVGIDASTFKKYNGLLQELKIFYYDNSYRTSDLKNLPTKFVRCRMWTEQEFRERIDYLAKDKNQKKYDKEAANIRRSNTQKRNYAKRKRIA